MKSSRLHLALTLIATAALLPLGSRAAFAQTETLVVTGNPGLLRVTTAVAGSEPIPVSNSSTSYTVVTGNPNRLYNITAQLNAPMPLGVTLNLTLGAPAGATSLGPIPLDVVAQDLVTGIGRRVTSTHPMTYQLVATAAAGVVPLSTRTVTLTIIRAP